MSLSKILYVDDEKENLVSFKYLFKKNFEILLAISAEEGLEILQREPIQIIITDQKMRHTTGVEFLKKIANRALRAIPSKYDKSYRKRIKNRSFSKKIRNFI